MELIKGVVGMLLMSALASGCGRSKDAGPAGSSLPVTSSQSAALPGATDAADAPQSPQVAESSTATLTMYRDPSTGVSFAYPSVWRPAIVGQSPVEPAFEGVAGKPRITQEFLPQGNYYAPTVLRALMFSYTLKDGSNTAACAQVAKQSVQAAATKQVSYGGRSYTEAAGGDAGMCTQVQSVVDTTLQGRKCFVFERDFVTMCPYVKSKTEPRPLTENETKALQRHLNAVMESVQIVGH